MLLTSLWHIYNILSSSSSSSSSSPYMMNTDSISHVSIRHRNKLLPVPYMCYTKFRRGMSYRFGIGRVPKIWKTLGATPLGIETWLTHKTRYSAMCYRTKFRRQAVSKQVWVPKSFGDAGAHPIGIWSRLISRSTLLLYLCYHARFGHSRSNCAIP